MKKSEFLTYLGADPKFKAVGTTFIPAVDNTNPQPHLGNKTDFQFRKDELGYAFYDVVVDQVDSTGLRTKTFPIKCKVYNEGLANEEVVFEERDLDQLNFLQEKQPPVDNTYRDAINAYIASLGLASLLLFKIAEIDKDTSYAVVSALLNVNGKGEWHQYTVYGPAAGLSHIEMA
jgi:hypothetical protein